jgi:hypothetical protein
VVNISVFSGILEWNPFHASVSFVYLVYMYICHPLKHVADLTLLMLINLISIAEELNEAEGKEQYRVEISNRFAALENLDTEGI